MSSPDSISAGFLASAPAPLRYASLDPDPDPIEVFGRFRALMPSGVRVLDVGCGAGGGTLAINDGKGNSIVCLEPDADRSQAARQRGLDCHTDVFDARTVSSLGDFDVVVFADVLEHLAAPAGALSLAREVLRPGGCVLISVPNVAHWSIRLRLLQGKFNYQTDGLMDATHLRWFTFKTLTLMLERCGFNVDFSSGSAGAWLSYYKLLPGRRQIVGALQRAMPGIFSCQLIMRATLGNEEDPGLSL